MFVSVVEEVLIGCLRKVQKSWPAAASSEVAVIAVNQYLKPASFHRKVKRADTSVVLRNGVPSTGKARLWL